MLSTEDRILKEISEQDQCAQCGLHHCKYVPWQHSVTPQYPVLLVGQAPGGTEVLTKVPFTGPAGKMLWRLLHEAGIDKSSLNITNIVMCAPPEDRMPSDKEIACCSPHLKEELQIVQPQLIVALGEVAAHALTGRSGIQSLRGQMFPLLSKWGYKDILTHNGQRSDAPMEACPVLCVLHPSFIMRQRQWIDIAIKDMSRIVSFFSPSVVVKEKKEPTFVIDPSDSELAELLGEMSKGVTAVDIETPAELDILTARVIGIAFCSSRELAVGLNLTEADKGSSKWEIMKRFLEDPNAHKCTQNGAFDTGVLETHGIIVEGLVYDTLLAEHTMNSDLPGKLDSLRGRYTDIVSYKPNAKSMKSIANWTNEQRSSMNCWDVITTLAVMMGQRDVMNNHQLKVLTDIEIPLIKVCNSMERKGVLVDVNTLALLHMELAPQCEAIRRQHFAPLGLNPSSPIQLKKYFDIDSTGEDELVALIKRGHDKAELMQAVLDYRGMQKTVSVYLIGVYERLRSGRIHAHFKITGTGTGRLSSQNPNLQNVPRDLRVIYIPDSNDYVLVNGDYNQLELRVVANLAPEPTMLKEFAEGKSTHKLIGYEVYHKQWEDLTDQQKLRAKTIVFGTMYGRTPRSIAIEFGVTVKQAEEWQRICVHKYPGLASYTRRQEQNFHETQRCSTPFGRVRFLQAVTQAYNTPVQSSAADVMMTTLIELYKQRFDLRITVHDSVVVQVPKKDLKEVSEAMRKVMERPIEQLNNYSFPVKLEVGDNWFEMEEV